MMTDIHKEKILVFDFGSQYTQLIARRIRESNVYCEIVPYDISSKKVKKLKPKGIVFSGGPASIYLPKSPVCDRDIFNLDIPILGICYGIQLMVYLMGGEVEGSKKREYGKIKLQVLDDSDLFYGLGNKSKSLTVWMSHGDKVTKIPKNFSIIAKTDNSPIAAVRDKKSRLYGLQFHPEVVHTPKGKDILNNFIFRICRCSPEWTMKSFIEYSIQNIKKTAGDKKVVCALSGGVDSSVVALLTHKAVGKELTCIFVNNGLLRKDEEQQVIETFKKNFDIDIHYVDAKMRFLNRLRNVVDPEKKRKIIGEEFISVFEAEAKKFGKVDFLAQGTLYPDVIESTSHRGPSATIKTHHNVGGLPKKMRFKLIEPLKELFKDEVRCLGKELGIPKHILSRHPFPGPGLAVRILGPVTKERIKILQEADAILIEELKKKNLYDDIWQAFAVLLPIKTVGVMGDERTYENAIGIRAVTSLDGMTADWARIPYDVLNKISNRTINEVKGVNRVVFDISSKPPSTIEWE
ncbi:MAG TPA: glutamine-hydrolyzing GMP synthase [Nitrospinota bacterium]|nr:glutamine-hydrolyzing GMP synthase [Nitrospinota bacterium]